MATHFEFQPNLIATNHELAEPGRGPRVKPGRRLWLTRDGKHLVPDGNPEAHTLFCTERSEVPKELFDQLTDGGRHVESDV